MTIGPAGSTPSSSPVGQPSPRISDPAAGDCIPSRSGTVDHVDLGRLAAMGRVEAPPGRAPMLVVPSEAASAGRPLSGSRTTRMLVGGTVAGAMGGAFVSMSLLGTSPLAGVGVLVGSTLLGGVMGWLAGREPANAKPPGGQPAK